MSQPIHTVILASRDAPPLAELGTAMSVAK